MSAAHDVLQNEIIEIVAYNIDTENLIKVNTLINYRKLFNVYNLTFYRNQ